MRYFKGYVAISDERDIPVLLHVRNARAISFHQLCELLLLEGVEKVRRVVNWRVSRLEQHGLIRRFEQDRFRGQPVFAITPLGLRVLESRGHYLLSLPSTTGRVIHPTQIPHAMELVNIRLALAKHGILRSWLGELEIASRNLVLESGVAKDYDAVAEILVERELRTFAIEYERTAKASARYREIREMLGRDRTVDVVLYLTSDRDVLYLLALEMRGTAKRIGLALSDSFRRDLLDTNTLLAADGSEVIPFRALFAA
ncbi:MAG TPA: replication-relaxation family protein [Acidobacteriaceae bacterium]